MSENILQNGLTGRSKLAILDGNCFIASGSYAKFSTGWNVKGFPTGGISALMKAICIRYRDWEDVIVVFDTKSFRKEKYPTYKANRRKDNKTVVQIKALVPLLRKAGINVFQVDGFEGDDLIWNCVKANYDSYDRIDIHTVDMDIACNIDALGKVRIKGATNVIPEITRNNFSSTVDKEYEIPFNAILPWKVLFGCTSDTIHPIEPAYARQLWSAFIKFGNSIVANKGMLSDRKVMDLFFSKIEAGIPKELAESLRQNIELVYPVEIKEVDGVPISFDCTSIGDMEEIRKILSLFMLARVCKNYTGKYLIPLDKRQEDWLFKRANDYKMGVTCMDEDMPIGKSLKDEVYIDMDEDITTAFKEKFERDDIVSGGSIGSFR